MARSWVIAILAFTVGVIGFTRTTDGKEKEKEKDIKITGKFTKDDPKDQARGGPSQAHAVKLRKGKTYTIHMASTELDSYLRLYDSKGNQIAEDDDSGGGLDAQIMFTPTMDGEYKIITTTFAANTYGNYVLTVKVAGGSQERVSSHAKLLSKDAHDFKADFVVNSKAASVSDYKGKVALLVFLDMRSGESTKLLAKLNEWDKAYKDKGLAIVGVTYYPSEINQLLEFDSEAGEIKTAKKADRASDQKLLAGYTNHHKVGFPVMMLTKKEALQAYDVYVVNGVPQVVLIDRKGIVRLVDVGGEKNAATVEADIKKLVAADN